MEFPITQYQLIPRVSVRPYRVDSIYIFRSLRYNMFVAKNILHFPWSNKTPNTFLHVSTEFFVISPAYFIYSRRGFVSCVIFSFLAGSQKKKRQSRNATLLHQMQTNSRSSGFRRLLNKKTSLRKRAEKKILNSSASVFHLLFGPQPGSTASFGGGIIEEIK